MLIVSHGSRRSRSGTLASGWFAAFLYGTLCAALVAVLYRWQPFVKPIIDLNGFGLLSSHLAQGKGFSLGCGPTVRRAPLYPLMGAAMLKLFGSEGFSASGAVDYTPILILNCALFGLTCVAVRATARRMFGPRIACLATVLCPLAPQSLRYVGMTEVETLMGLFIVLLAWTGLDLVERPRLSSGISFGLTAAAATLSKPVALFYPVVFLLAAWWHWRVTNGAESSAGDGARARLRWTASSAALVCFSAALLPWMIRNSIVTEERFTGISSNGPGEFLRGYIIAQPQYSLLRQDIGGDDQRAQKWDPEANDYEEALLARHGVRLFKYEYDRSRRYVISAERCVVASAQLEAEKDRIEAEEVKRRLVHEPLDFLHKFVVQLATFWYIVETRAKSALVGAVAVVFLTLAALGVVRARRQGTVAWPVVFVILYMNVVYAAILALGRYSMPVYPTLTILSCAGLASLVPRFLSDPSGTRMPL